MVKKIIVNENYKRNTAAAAANSSETTPVVVVADEYRSANDPTPASFRSLSSSLSPIETPYFCVSPSFPSRTAKTLTLTLSA